jgi:hypothetical protein
LHLFEVIAGLIPSMTFRGGKNNGLRVADCRSRVLRRLQRVGADLQLAERGGLIMDWTVVLALIVAGGLLLYLFVALLLPERLS